MKPIESNLNIIFNVLREKEGIKKGALSETKGAIKVEVGQPFFSLTKGQKKCYNCYGGLDTNDIK